ncbi:MAG: hypothetical protein IIC99_04275 [Chloroflexi bacterium]|nr:hypothetical protein [Chloroflexota bacterium]
MAKISITLPNITEISLEAADASEMRQIVGLFKSDLLNELVRLPSVGAQTKEVPGGPDNDINVPPKASIQTPPAQAASNGNDHASSTSARDIPEAAPLPLEARVNPPVEPGAAEPPTGQPTGRQVPATIRSDRGTSPDTSIPGTPRNPSIPPELSDPRLGHDFTVFCRTVNPMGDMRKVVAAAEGAARMFSMENVDAWELGHLFDMTGWPQPHSFTQALRNAARSKFRWLERVPGRSGRYSVTDAGRAVVLKGTNLL